MIYRPSLARAGRTAGVGLVVWLIAALSSSVPPAVRVVAWCLVVATPIFMFVVGRTRIWIRDEDVEVRTVRGTDVFRAEDSSVREFAVPGGLTRHGQAVEFRNEIGKTVSVHLGGFSPEARSELLVALREVLPGRLEQT